MLPAASILLPVRDAASTLPAALDGLLCDSLRDIEVIAVDDGSHDETPQLLDDFARIDPRIRVFHQARLGLVPALNRGLAEVRGEILVRHDADDVSVPGRVHAQAEFLRTHPEVDLVATRCRLFRDDGPAAEGMRHWAAWSNRLGTHEEILRSRFIESPFAHPAVALRTEVLRRVGGYREGDFPEDYELWLRLLAGGSRFARLRRVGVLVREHLGRTIHRDSRYRPGAFRRLKREHLEREFLRPDEPLVLFGGGRVAKAWLRDFLAAGRPVAALADLDPRRIGMRIEDVPVVHAREAARGGRFGGLPALGALGRPRSRAVLRQALPSLGRVEGSDFYFVA